MSFNINMKIKPLRTLPEVLIYKMPDTFYSGEYRMINTKTGKFVGEMITSNLKLEKKYLGIAILNIFKKRQGYGTRFLNFAKKLSQEQGAEGRLILKATTMPQDPHNPPHIFYRKFGFTTEDKKQLKKIDRHIKKNKQLNWLETPNLIMTYPDTTPKKKGLLENIKEKLYNYFNN